MASVGRKAYNTYILLYGELHNWIGDVRVVSIKHQYSAEGATQFYRLRNKTLLEPSIKALFNHPSTGINAIEGPLRPALRP